MIAVDANGADQGPGAVAEGVRRSGVPVLLFGPRIELVNAGDHAEVVDAPESIKAGDEPVAAVRSRKGASIVQAAAAVGAGRADALVSAGSTGPTLAAGTVSIKRIRGVFRPALAVLLPVPGGPVLLLDAGASVQARPEHLVQFAYMGASFMEACVGIERPRVGLLSVGEESGKGTPEVLAAHDRLAEGTLNFAGNIEGFDLPRASVDVIVADGFSGNVALKVLEGTVKSLTGAIGARVRSGPVSSLGGLLIRGKLRGLRDELDPEGVGGAILLGLRKPVVVGHGSFGPRGIESAVRLAQRAVDEDMVGRTSSALAAAGALRSAPAGSVVAATSETSSDA
ncbi:MAG: phosphate acyltransferase [Thermoleophilaceae bacterium]|nr:phosphate acyltransferase [Thermoleophilaceae bacterium]